MAGDWLKFEKVTLDKPEVFEMAGILGIDPDAVVGKLLRVWNWFDDHSETGHAPVTLESFLDRAAGVSGFVEAMIRVGWMKKVEESLILPNFDRHNGKPAKTRALAANRKRNQRANGHAERHAPSVTESATEARPEKRREEIIPPLFPPQGETIDHGRHLPNGWKKLSRADQKLERVLSNSPTMIAINSFFGRKPDTLWTVADALKLWKIRPSPEDVELLARYYREPLDKDEDIRRRELSTLLNNWFGELDKARSHYANTAA